MTKRGYVITEFTAENDYYRVKKTKKRFSITSKKKGKNLENSKNLAKLLNKLAEDGFIDQDTATVLHALADTKKQFRISHKKLAEEIEKYHDYLEEQAMNKYEASKA